MLRTRSARRARAALAVLGGALLAGSAGCAAREQRCRGFDADGAWQSYTAGHIDEAYEAFADAVARCPAYDGGRIGLGYAALRRGELELAVRMFDAVLAGGPQAVDALLGSGIVHWRLTDYERARQRFERVVAIDPRNAEALGYLARYPAVAQTIRADLPMPDSLAYHARVAGDRFEVRGAAGWEPFYVQGVNIGAAVPGTHPSEFPDSATYANWLRLIGAMGANTVRVYTIHPPHFYQALLDYNTAQPAAPLRVLHGVWAELPPGDTAYGDADWQQAFYRDMRMVVDVVHGRAELPLRVGRASGFYNADVSPWVLGYILGREWEAHSVAGYNAAAHAPSAWVGRYVQVAGGTPMDVWLARAIDEIIAYETARYGAQRPVAYTNWPPTDPLHHPSEPDVAEEQAIRRAFGDTVTYAPVHDGNDAVTLDPTVIRGRDTFAAGYFAAYHVYPYYPDFMVLDAQLNEANSPYGPSNYWGYLVRLKARHEGLPVLIAEYGVPASIGNAHFQPQGWHHGGITEAAVAEINARLTREIAAAGMAGGVVFAWIDEWFKKTWNTEPFEVPRERARLWRNRMDAEEHYGMLAAEPMPAVPGTTEAERHAAWQAIRPLLTAADGSVLRAAADEAYLSVYVEYGAGARVPDELLIGFDVLDSGAGEFRWPGGAGARLPVGLEFVLSATRERTRLLAHAPYNPVRLAPLDFEPPGPRRDVPAIAGIPPGFFRGRLVADVRVPLRPQPSEAGSYEPLLVLPNRLRFGRDSTEYTAMGYDWGILPAGPLPDGLWTWGERALEVRVPWQLLNVSDPSQRRVLAYTAVRDDDELGTVTVGGIRLLLGVRTGSELRTWPAANGAAEVPLFSWTTWDAPRWRMRVRPSYWAIRDAWRNLAPAFAAHDARMGEP